MYGPHVYNDRYLLCDPTPKVSPFLLFSSLLSALGDEAGAGGSSVSALDFRVAMVTVLPHMLTPVRQERLAMVSLPSHPQKKFLYYRPDVITWCHKY